MKYHFENLKQTSFNNFKENHSSPDGKFLKSKTNDGKSSQIIGKIFLLKDNNYKEITNNKTKNINKNKKEKILEEEKILLDERKKCHLEFLSKLNSFYQNFQKEINDRKNKKSSNNDSLYINISFNIRFLIRDIFIYIILFKLILN